MPVQSLRFEERRSRFERWGKCISGLLRLGPAAAGEGCLSFPEIFAEISRPESVDVKALNEKGRPVTFRCGGLLARAVQHEKDHLNGILFIDRMERKQKEEFREELDALQAATKAELKKK